MAADKGGSTDGKGYDEDFREGPYSLGKPAKDVYEQLVASTRRQSVIDMARIMSELTIPSVFPPDGYKPGDDLPGNNQSIGAQCVNNLASNLMFMAFPPGQPMCRLDPIVHKMQAEIAANPELYANTQLALSQLEIQHRKKAATIPLATAWVGYMKALLVGGNALWKHITLESPTYALPDRYVVRRDKSGHPLLTIHEEPTALSTLDDDIVELLLRENEGLNETDEWDREARIYSVCMLDGPVETGSWLFWQETEKGTLIPGSEVETDYNDVPMWPGWLIPVYGESWGRSYCEEYRGDLFTVEAGSSALNDGAAWAAFTLGFVKPGGRTSLRQVQKARNLSWLSGSAEDVTTLRSEKGNDMRFIEGHVARAERRLGVAFLMHLAVRRDGERVTAEEVQHTAQALDKAMGGLYTERAQGDQRRMVTRFIRLHEEADEQLPVLPDGIVNIEVVTGVDAMGRSIENQQLRELGGELNQTFGPQAAGEVLNRANFATRLAASKGIKPDGLVKTEEQLSTDQQDAQQQALQADVMGKAAGPTSGALVKGLMANMQQQTPPQEG